MSVQMWHDNVVNPCRASTYRFLRKVVDEVVAIYAEAGATLTTIHTGGDEVPEGVWEGSPSCQALLDEAQEGVASVEDLASHFLRELNAIAASHGLVTGGWEEIALRKVQAEGGVHAEAFTVAEVQHGPMALVDERFPLLVFAPRGPAQAGLVRVAEEFRAQGAKVILVGPAGLPGVDLAVPASPHELLDPLCQILAFYLAAAALAEARGLDPDAPRRLKKVTKTL
ncbi:family 20 glycosylhydrolase [Sorangium sp. So ce341]|uniref:SIS domain-containing protein n=1 Tax=Sorangium sp. So ce341 TaxID=3133302 RepID=UPI003F635FEF